MNVQELNKIITKYGKDTPVLFRRVYPDGGYVDFSILVFEEKDAVLILLNEPIQYQNEVGQ